MKGSIPVSRIMTAFLLTVVLASAGIALAGSAAEIEKYTNRLQNKDSTPHERSYAAQQLGFAGLDSPAAAQALTGALENDRDAGVRASAAIALGIVGLPDSAYIEALIKALKSDSNPAVRSAAAQGLDLIGGDSAAAAQALKKAAVNDPSANVRKIAAKVYNRITSTD
jgi:HEAT repeat protein